MAATRKNRSSKSKTTKTKVKAKAAKNNTRRTTRGKNLIKSPLKNFFSFGKPSSEKSNFSTRFNYGSFMFDIDSKVKSGVVQLDINVSSENFKFDGTLDFNEDAFGEVQKLLKHILANIPNIR